MVDETITADTPDVATTQQTTETTIDTPVVDAAPPAAAPEPEKPVTALDVSPDEAAASLARGDKWREEWAEGDEKVFKRLQRLSSQRDVLKWALNVEKKMSSGEHKRWSPSEGSDDTALATFRKERGIPEVPEEYLTGLPDGFVIGDADRPAFDKFAEVFHAQHVPAAAGKELVKAYFEAQQAAADARSALDQQQKVDTIVAARERMGHEYPAAANSVVGIFDTAPEEVKHAVMNARDPYGNLIFNNIQTFEWFANLARELNPLATIVPGNAADAGQTLDAEIHGIEQKMGDTHSDYWRGQMSPKSPGETVMQVRYRELVNAKNKLRR